MRPVRVTYVVSWYPGVSHTFIQREIRALRALGNHVDVVSIHRASPDVMSAADLEELASTFTILPASPMKIARGHAKALLRSPRAYFDTLRHALSVAPPGARARLWQLFYFVEAMIVWERCRRRDVRHLHAHFANVGADVAWLTCHFGRAVDGPGAWSWSFTMHGCMEFWDVERYNLGRKVAASDLVIAISDFTRAQLMNFVEPEHWDKIEVVHCGVDVDTYRPAAADGERSQTTRVLCVGRLSPEKGQTLLLKAIADLRASGIDTIQLTLVGDGPLRAALERECSELRLADVVTFAGAVDQDAMPEYYRRADVFCQPSFMEGIPVVLMEAMASGLAVVSSGVAGIPELIDDGESGILVRPGRTDELARAIAELARDPARREALGRRGRETVLRDFDARENAAEVATRFRHLSSRASAPGRQCEG